MAPLPEIEKSFALASEILSGTDFKYASRLCPMIWPQQELFSSMLYCYVRSACEVLFADFAGEID
jgi:hypothetical protein